MYDISVANSSTTEATGVSDPNLHGGGEKNADGFLQKEVTAEDAANMQYQKLLMEDYDPTLDQVNNKDPNNLLRRKEVCCW